MSQGYTMVGRNTLFLSYEAFIGISQTMMFRYAKLVKMVKETNLRAPNAPFNYIETSTWTRQEHTRFKAPHGRLIQPGGSGDSPSCWW